MQSVSCPSARGSGFTLIEMSIVLVIIGLIVGGVLVGQDLIRAAYIRAQVSQIEKYNTAVNTFRGKYGALPGDLNAMTAGTYGFAPRGPLAGEGDGNGVIQGNHSGLAAGVMQSNGETVMFWSDLTYANGMNLGMIEGNFSLAAANNNTISTIPMTALDEYFPTAKIGSNHVMVWSGGWAWLTNVAGDSTNYFTIVPTSGPLDFAEPWGGAGVTVIQAYNIDKKTDDGLPQSGSVTAISPNFGTLWAGGAGAYDPTTEGPVVAGDGVSTTPSPSTCYDNGPNSGATEQYSITTNGGAGVNCTLSFRFQ
jgi:prepilin-type N-terminal cleavage/methylation domain-containing protein